MKKSTVGNFISILRKSKGYTQANLADTLGVSSKTVSKWECNDGMPDIMLLPVLAEVLEVSIEEILMGGRLQADKNSTGANNKRSDRQIKILFNKQELRFRNLSLVSLGIGILSIALSIIFLATASSEKTLVIWAIGLVLILATIIIQLININSTTGILSTDEDAFMDFDKIMLYKKAIKATIFNWSYNVFALIFASVVLCIFVLYNAGGFSL